MVTNNSRSIGRVVGLWRYPVKSMAGEALTTIDVGWHGFAGDRRWAFVQNRLTHSGFPWLTLRERNDMSHYQPSFVNPSRPDKSPTQVRTPSDQTFDVTDPQLAAELWPDGVRVIRLDRGAFDTLPLSIITTKTIAGLGESVGAALDTRRFRPNILVEADDDTPFVEDDWLGCMLRIGNLQLRIDKRDGRCMVITIDPVTTQRDPAILRAVVAERQGCLGVYGSTVEPGCMSLGNKVIIDSLG